MVTKGRVFLLQQCPKLGRLRQRLEYFRNDEDRWFIVILLNDFFGCHGADRLLFGMII